MRSHRVRIGSRDVGTTKRTNQRTTKRDVR
jgi:hypothetical protein